MLVQGRKLLAAMLVLAMVAAGIVVPGIRPAKAAAKTIILTIGSLSTTVDGKSVKLGAAPFVAGGRTMLPVRFVAEQMGAGVSFTTTSSGKVTQVNLGLPKSDTALTAVTLSLSSTTAQVNGKKVTLDTKPVIRNGLTFVPIRFVAEQMGAKVSTTKNAGNGRTATVTITLPVVSIKLATQLSGAGSTAALPLYQTMFDGYAVQAKTRVNYQGIGSGGGIKALTDKTVDFGASDAFLTDQESTAVGAPVIHVPTCVVAVVLTYNLDGKPTLRFDAKTIGDIFLGKITKWNDSRIAALNPGVKLPDLAITTVHRSDGSGTTSIFTNYLAAADSEWKTKVGAGKSVSWPNGLGGKGSDGIAGIVAQNKGSLGYVELVYAINAKLPYAAVENSSGKFITASLASSSRAANVALPDDLKILLMNSSDSQAYPISAFTWVIVYRDQNYKGHTLGQAIALKNLLSWMMGNGQAVNEGLGYGKLPQPAVQKAQKLISSLTYGEAPLP